MSATQGKSGVPPPVFTQQHIGGAMSKMISASIGDVAVVFSKSAAHKHHTLADLHWLILPAVYAGQVYIAEAQDVDGGFRAPIAVVTWARVSEEVDRRLTETAGQSLRLRPDEWASGDRFWLIDFVGEPVGLRSALASLVKGIFKDQKVKIVTRTPEGITSVEPLAGLSDPADQSAQQ
jgi:hemolysin-activating ACP:hemolysin acyltransferase